ncbi:MAG: hypothetical protein P4M11_00955 [Candidatus Pacebacteria bacterium]|nr:hypothetical protein [Candidatus Paceibacterota bacterium]
MIKTLSTFCSKCTMTENLRPIFVALRGIFEKKEKAMAELQDIADEVDQLAAKSVPADEGRNVPAEAYPDRINIKGRRCYFVLFLSVKRIELAKDKEPCGRENERSGASCTGPLQLQAEERRHQKW